MLGKCGLDRPKLSSHWLNGTHCQMVQNPMAVPQTISRAPGTRPILLQAFGVVIITA